MSGQEWGSASITPFPHLIPVRKIIYFWEMVLWEVMPLWEQCSPYAAASPCCAHPELESWNSAMTSWQWWQPRGLAVTPSWLLGFHWESAIPGNVLSSVSPTLCVADP